LLARPTLEVVALRATDRQASRFYGFHHQGSQGDHSREVNTWSGVRSPSEASRTGESRREPWLDARSRDLHTSAPADQPFLCTEMDRPVQRFPSASRIACCRTRSSTARRSSASAEDPP